MTLLVGIDLGTSGMKAVAADPAGRPVAQASCPYPTARPERGAAEQDPDEWLRATGKVLRSLTEQLGADRGAGRIAAVALSAMIPTLVCLGPDGRPLGPAITWEDSRAEPWGEKFVEAAGGDALYDKTGQPVDGRYLIPMYRRLAETESVRASTICGAKDYLYACLTGELLTDPSTATGFGCFDLRAQRFDEALVQAQTSLPPVAPSTTVGRLTRAVATDLGLAPGTPVVLGAADSVLGARGLGATQVGDTVYLWGTSTVILQVAGEPELDPKRRYLVTPLWNEHLYGLEMDLLSTGAALAWLAGLVRADTAQLVEDASSLDPRSAPLFLPFVGGGEQGALSDPNLRGALVGLDAGNTRAELGRALLNGILRETRRILDRLRPPLTGGRHPLRGAGGPLGGAGFRKDLASAARTAVLSPHSRMVDHSALGAALLAAEALGVAEQRSDGAGDEGFDRTEPSEERAAAFDEVFARYDELFASLYPATAARASSS